MQLTLRIDWSDMDLFGHVNNIAYFKYIQAARVNFWEQTGIMKEYQKTGNGPVLASCHCNFKKSLEYPGKVLIETAVSRAGDTSFDFTHTLKDEAGNLVAIATDVIVMIDYKTQKKSPVPEKIRALLTIS